MLADWNNRAAGDRLRWPTDDPYYTKTEVDALVASANVTTGFANATSASAILIRIGTAVMLNLNGKEFFDFIF